MEKVCKLTGVTWLVATEVLLFLILLPLQGHSFAAGHADIPDWILNGKKLRTEKWDNGGWTSSLAKEWPIYSGEQGLDEKDIKKRTELEVMGVRFRVEQHQYRNGGPFELVSYSVAPFPETFCKNIFGQLKSSLGTGMSEIGKKDSGYESYLASWKIGKSSVRFSCSGAKIYDKYISTRSVFQIGPESKVDQIQKTSYIECEGVETSLTLSSIKGFSVQRQVGPFILSIDPNLKQLCRSSGACYEKRLQFSNMRVEFENTEVVRSGEPNEALEVKRIFIDRQSRVYRIDSEIRTKDVGVIHLAETGKCKKSTGDQKF